MRVKIGDVPMAVQFTERELKLVKTMGPEPGFFVPARTQGSSRYSWRE